MFSCCRANPKNSSTKSAKKDKHKKTSDDNNEGGDEEHNDNDEQPEKTVGSKKLIIPTITIENGKTCDDDAQEAKEKTGATTTTAAVGDDENVSECSDFKENSFKSENADLCSNATETATADIAADVVKEAEAEQREVATTQTQIAAQPHDQSDDQLSKSSPTSFSDDGSANSAINLLNATHSSTTTITTADTEADATPAVVLVAAEANAKYSAQQQQQQQLQQEQQSSQPAVQPPASQQQQRQQTQPPPPPKSCLSRHNSTHTSFKKKVNISAYAEIIEPDPLPPPPDHGSLGDDDDVFSDSLPPPKRESMCAPYIETGFGGVGGGGGGGGIGGDELPDAATLAAAFAHGLPEWFNDERINDTGCIEPPVTPVGRDELEMKRQRLYTDLMRAAHAAVEHSVRFTPAFGGGGSEPLPSYMADARTGGAGDCDPDLKPSVAENLEHLVNRLERLVERLERSVSARELEIANRTFDTVLAEKKRESFDLETTELPPLPPPVADDDAAEVEQQVAANALNLRIERIESTLHRINDRHSSSSSHSSASVSQSQSQHSQSAKNAANSLEHIPTTVLEDYSYTIPAATVAAVAAAVDQEAEEQEALLLPPPPPSMSVLGYQDIVSGSLSQYLALSAKIGGDVAKHAQFVKAAFDAQLQYVTLATQCAQPGQDKQMELLKPTSTQISAIQDYREKNRASPFFNHLSAISESIPALGWVCVSPTPGPHVKEMNDAGQFYTNRVLKEWKEKDSKHVEWARAWVQTLTELQAYIKQYHTTGLVWSGKGSVAAVGGAAPPPPPPIGACPPPPPPPAFDLAAMSLGDDGDERSALFAQINQGENITRNLKRVTDDMQTHKNPTLRTGPAPFKTPAQFGSAASGGPSAPKEPVFTRDGKKWIIEHQKNNASLLVDNVEMNNVVYVFKCEGSTLTVKGKLNNIVMDSCKKCSLLCDSVVASIEFVNCQSVQMQVLGHVPTVSIDKTDGCQMYLSKDSLGVEIIQSKSSEMNVMLPAASGDYTELALPEQFKTTISGKTLKTVCVDSLG